MPGLRGWHRIASGFLLVAAGAHLVAHWRFYLGTDAFDPPRRTVMEAMQAFVVFPPTGATLWTVLQMFGLCFAIVFALLGTHGWFLAREADPAALRRHAIRNAVLCFVATLALAALHPVPQAQVIVGGAMLLFGAGALVRGD